MEMQIKKTVKAGNSSAVILPRSWLNKEVRIELVKKTLEAILSDVLEILKKHINSRDIIGIYLVGSYARGDEDKDSDVDLLIITKDTDKTVYDGIYNLTLISSELLRQKLEKDLLPIGQMIKEAQPLLNSYYLDSLEVKVTKRNIKWYLDTTRDKLKLIRKVLEKTKKSQVSDLVIYTLVLRIRTLYLINKLTVDEVYSKKNFVNLIKEITNGKESYERYIAIKNDAKDKNIVNVKTAELMVRYLDKQLMELKRSE